MDYYRLVKRAYPAKTAIIEDGNAYTYGEISGFASVMAEQISGEQEYNANILKIQGKTVYIIKENGILEQLVAFLACNAANIIPIIVPSDARKLPETSYVPDNACMAVMTSGTTGIPKVLYRTYKSWAGFFPVQNEIFGINKESVIFAHGSLAFTGNLNLYMAQFYVQGTIVAENKFNPKRWAYVINKENVNTIYLIPSKLMLLPSVIKEINKNVKSIISGSQSLGYSDAIKLKEVFPMAEITLYYGASELNYITYVKDRDMTIDKNLIGKPFPGIRVFVNNGNIYVDSPYHAEGIKCPYSVSDKGHIDQNGCLYFEGRSDDIVLIHGRKISLIRIENELESLEEVREAAVIPIIENGKQVIAAFIDMGYNINNFVVNGNGCISINKEKDVIILKKLSNNDKIFTSLRKKLAHYEMPCKIIVIDDMPHNESGKKDKKKIQEMWINMDFIDLAKERYSLRNMDKNHPVEKEKLEKIAEAARISPSACNLQRHRLKIVTSKEGIEKLRGCTNCHFNAPAVFIISLEKDTGSSPMDEKSGMYFGLIDIGIVAAHMSLQAAELGVGTTIVGMFDKKKIIEEFNIPNSCEPVLIMPAGYPADNSGPCILHKSRLSIDKTTEWV